MKIRILFFIALIALATSSAYALTPAQIATARAAGTLKEVWLSGSSSATRNVFESFKIDCTDAVHFYTSDTLGTVPGSAGNFLAYSCTTATLGKTVFYNTVAGGSFNAFAPHVVGTQLLRVKRPDNNTCVVNANPLVYNSCTTINPVTLPDGSVVKPDGGLSDVESTLFADLFNTSASSVGTEVNACVGQVFGVAVSTNLYRALQTKQAIVAPDFADCRDDTYVISGSPAVGTYTRGPGLSNRHDFRTPSCMPTISYAQYTSMVARGGGYQNNWQPLLGLAGANKAVNLCRRVPTSGTQAASNAYLLDNPCKRGLAGGQLLAATVNDSTATFPTDASGIFITESSGTSDVKKCLNKANDNTNQYFAFGPMSMENDPFIETLTDRDDYRFVKLDCASPENADDDRARENAINGEYRFAMEMTAFTANTASASGAAIISTILANISNPAVTNLRGLFVSPACGADHNMFPTQVHKGSKLGNSCQPWIMFF